MSDMFSQVYVVLDDASSTGNASGGAALAKIIEFHPDLEPLLDFNSPDPIEIAHEIGMVHPQEEDSADDLAEVDLGSPEWHEAAAGIIAVERALAALRADPSTIGRYLYDPALTQDDVIADLEALLSTLEDARDREVRFRIVVEGKAGMWPRP